MREIYLDENKVRLLTAKMVYEIEKIIKAFGEDEGYEGFAAAHIAPMLTMQATYHNDAETGLYFHFGVGINGMRLLVPDEETNEN